MSKTNFYVTIMSIDPDDHYGREQGDDHQKYGYSLLAKDKKDAENKAVEEFKRRHGDLPIHWVEVF